MMSLSLPRVREALPRLGHGDGPMIGISIGHAMTHWYPGAFTVLLPFFAQDLGLTYTQIGILLGLRNITSTLINIPGGMLVDLIGRHKVIMGLAIAWAGIPYLFLGLTTNFVIIAACLAIVGVGNLLYHPAALSSLSEMYPSRRGFATAMHSLGASFGDTAAPFCVGLVLTWLTWREVTLYNAIPGIVMSVIFWQMMRNVHLRTRVGKNRLDVRSYLHGAATLLRNVNMLMIALLGGARSMTQSGLTLFLPIYLLNVVALSPALVGTYLAIVQGAGIISGPISGSLSDRFGRRPIVAAGMISTSVLLVGLMALNVEWLFIFVLALIGFFLYSTAPVLNAWALDIAPRELGGTSIGILFTAMALLGSVAPIIGGALADEYGLPAAFYFIAATVLAANVLVLGVREDRTRSQEPGARSQ